MHASVHVKETLALWCVYCMCLIFLSAQDCIPYINVTGIGIEIGLGLGIHILRSYINWEDLQPLFKAPSIVHVNTNKQLDYTHIACEMCVLLLYTPYTNCVVREA